MVTIYFAVDENGYLDGWGSTRSSDEEIELTLDEEHELFKSDVYCWKYEDGELVFDTDKQQKLLTEHEKEQNKLSADELNTLALFELAQEIEALRIENQELRGGVMK